MTVPTLGPRGEGLVVAQLGLAAVIVAAGVAGPRWPGAAASFRVVLGIVIGLTGWVFFVAGVAGLGRSLTPFPKPSERSSLRVDGIYRVVRHPIYGGSMLVALGWSLMSSALARWPLPSWPSSSR